MNEIDRIRESVCGRMKLRREIEDAPQRRSIIKNREQRADAATLRRGGLSESEVRRQRVVSIDQPSFAVAHHGNGIASYSLQTGNTRSTSCCGFERDDSTQPKVRRIKEDTRRDPLCDGDTIR
jgi:hypothetical protein